MMVAELIAQREFRLTQQTPEDPGPGEVQMRIDAVGLCGSDVHSYAEGGIGDTPCQYPMVLGHEPAGTVVRTGAGVTGWSPGDRAALEPALYCYHCDFCRAGRYNICENIRFLSNPGHPGFFREFVNLPVENLFALPAHVSMELATLVEPLAVTLHSMQFAAIGPDDTVAVYGGGAIGLLTIACLKVAGAKRILAVEPVAHRRELAKHMGADDAVHPSEQENIRGVHCAIDCAAKDDSTNAAIRAVRNGGRVLLTGIHTGALVPFEISPMRRKELAVYMVRRSNDELPAALSLVAERTAWFAPLVTHCRPLDQIAEAFSIAENYLDGVGKLVVTAPGSR